MPTSTHTFSSTIPLACDAPPNGLALSAVPRCFFLYDLSCHRCSLLCTRILRAVLSPRGFPKSNNVCSRSYPLPLVANFSIQYSNHFQYANMTVEGLGDLTTSGTQKVHNMEDTTKDLVSYPGLPCGLGTRLQLILRLFFHSRVKSQCNSLGLIGTNLNYLCWSHPQCAYLLSS